MDHLSHHGGLHVFANLGAIRIHAGKSLASGSALWLRKPTARRLLRARAQKISSAHTARSLRSSNPKGLIILIDDRGQVGSN